MVDVVRTIGASMRRRPSSRPQPGTIWRGTAPEGRIDGRSCRRRARRGSRLDPLWIRPGVRELIPLLHEGASIYAGRGSAACGRIRARILATFGDVGLPVTALPFVIEALRAELNPEIVAGAAIAARGLAGSDSDLGKALVDALDNLRGRDAPVALLSDREESTALLEILASLRWQPAVNPDLVDAVRKTA